MGRTLKDLLNTSIETYGDRVALRVLRQEHGELRYHPVTYAELGALRDQLAAALQGLGLKPGRRLGVLTDGGVEPLYSFLAADLIGASAVPLCTKAPAEVIIHSINHSSLDVIVVDPKGRAQLDRVRGLLERPPQVILTRGHDERADEEGMLTWEALLESARGAAPEPVAVTPDHESKILYTSGSSGLPKGVVQTHANIVANLEEVWDSISGKEHLRFFKSAPDYHSLGILNIYFPLAKGWTLDMARSPERVLADIRTSEPEGLLTVPLILDKVYAGVRKEIDKGGLKGALVKRAVDTKARLSAGTAGVGDRLFYHALGHTIVGKIKEQLASRVGRHLELLVVGSAKADPEALDFFQDVLDITTFEGYGTTECAPLVATNNRFARKTGTVGKPLLHARIVGPGERDLGTYDPVTGTFHTSGQHGELWVRGPNVMKGYLGDPDETAQVLIEDEQGQTWYRTGDLFALDEDGFLVFGGRVGRQFKLKNGEFVNPEQLERLYARVGLVEHVVVYGDHARSYPLPLVTVNLEEARALSDVDGLPLDDEDALRVCPALAERLRELFLAELDRVSLPEFNRPQRVLLLPEPLSEEHGTLTKGLKKIVPGAVAERYRQQVEAAYAS